MMKMANGINARYIYIYIYIQWDHDFPLCFPYEL